MVDEVQRIQSPNLQKRQIPGYCDYHTEESFNTYIERNKLLTNRGITLFSHNVRSLPRHDHEIKLLLSNLSINFDIIGLCETWITDGNKDLYGFNGYHTPVQSIRNNRRGGGVALYLKKDLEFVVRSDLNFNNEFSESVFVEIDKSIYNTEKNIIIGTIYRVPNSDLDIFNKDLALILMKVNKEGKLFYLMGDTNIDLLKSSDHSLTSEFLDLMYSHNMFPLITKPTRVTNDSATLIDNIFTNNLKNSVKHHQGIIYNDISDHFPVFHMNEEFSLKQVNSKYT